MGDIYNQRVIYYRKLSRLTQAEVAEKLNMKTSTYSQLERNGKIGVDQLIKLAEIIDVDVELLLYGNEKSNSEAEKPSFVSDGQKGSVVMQQQPSFFQIPEIEAMTFTKLEENYIKILRNLPKKDRDEIIALINEKYKKNK